ncbi:AlpA family phage regulatory protein [Stutzerimonas stutzeri]|uniref:helix-turn-helix transcriptional regulator n=1 Tax=Stutzerimonas stutzeri TaxID=316 RepID=UPI00387DD389
MSSQEAMPITMLRLKEVTKRTGLCRSTIYNKLDSKSPRYDASFPKQVKLGSGTVRWIEAEISLWLEKCINISRQYSKINGGKYPEKYGDVHLGRGSKNV